MFTKWQMNVILWVLRAAVSSICLIDGTTVIVYLLVNGDAHMCTML